MINKFALLFCFLLPLVSVSSQSGIDYHEKKVFLNGANIAWVRFSRDLGPGSTDFVQFQNMFKAVSQNGGNNMRFWMHTTGSNSPQFDNNGLVIGPGVGTIDDLKKILDLAWENDVTLMLCLWSFDMLRISNGELVTGRNELMLRDTTYLNAYIRNALIPIVEGVKGHPAIQSWEVFNEPEGMSEEFGWDFNYHVPMNDIQRFINKVAGAIHRVDSEALVTNGSWSFMAMTDVDTPGLLKSATRSDSEIKDITEKFNLVYNTQLSSKDVINQIDAASHVMGDNINYYSDDRLIAAGGDSDGTLDYYTVHYYSWAGTALSPFHHPYEYWQLDKPLAVAEFFLENTYGIAYQNLYENLFLNGYAGALAWQYADGGAQRTRMLEAMKFMDEKYRRYTLLSDGPGRIYSLKSDKGIIELGDSVMIRWETAIGSKTYFNSVEVANIDSVKISPQISTTYELTTTGDFNESRKITIEVLQPGEILDFYAYPRQIEKGEIAKLFWLTSRGSEVTLNGNPVNYIDSIEVSPDTSALYELKTLGSNSQVRNVMLQVLSADQVNRALSRPVSASSFQTDTENIPENAVDGNLSTLWNSMESDVQWFEVDLEKEIFVNKILIKWGTSYASKFRIGISTDKMNWQVVYTTIEGTGGYTDVSNLYNKGRFVKILFDKRAPGSSLYSIKEIEIYGTFEGTTDIEFDKESLPTEFELLNNYPNPFNPATVIEYQLPVSAKSVSYKTTLKIFDILGRQIAVLVNEEQKPGRYKYQFDASELSSGIYLYQLKSGFYSSTKRMILIK